MALGFAIAGGLRNLVAGMALVALALGGTARAENATTLTYAMYSDIKEWDPAIAFSLEAILLRNVYEPLVWYEPGPDGTSTLKPALATTWSCSADGLSWTFSLRRGVRFHDGTPFNAGAAKAALERTIAMGLGAAYIWDAVTEIAAPNDDTLIIRTREPAPIDLIAAAQYGAYFYSPTAALNGSSWFNEGHAAGTGPYRVRQWAKGQQVILESNSDYWGTIPKNAFHRINLRVALEAATQAQMIRSGEADIITLAPVDLLPALRANSDVTVRIEPSWTNAQFLINTGKYPTDNRQFRRALTYAWDYATVAAQIYEGTADVARGVIPATMWASDPSLDVPEFDIAKAQALLQASGVPKADWRLRASYIDSSTEYGYAMLYYQAILADLGVDLKLRPGPWSQIWDEAQNQRSAPHLISMTWWPTYPTPADWLVGLFRTEEPTLFNLSHYANPAYDALVDKGRRQEALDRDEAIRLYRAAQNLLIDDAVAIFYADVNSRLVYRADLSGLDVNPAYAGVPFLPIRRNEPGPN